MKIILTETDETGMECKDTILFVPPNAFDLVMKDKPRNGVKQEEEK